MTHAKSSCHGRRCPSNAFAPGKERLRWRLDEPRGLEQLRGLKGLNLVGADVVEEAPVR
ncbi:hypothetical protein BN77_p10445 [Rhizobium mesoamericanum STM3625]|uniref:Uncharacterized protein n=1 Tax=Rhizobium mesoamericanum STM3625 TaxID=1211777 RepID=K0Q640_9HYPH|nr:hypothetical protein BN77_p10445 [Rhizobium mesoamericanum STM3625]